MKKVFLLSYLLLHFLIRNGAQDFYFERIGTIEGENNLSVRKIVQDKRGIMWFATFSGLYRYEGNEFIVKHNFIHNQKINPDVTSLLLDNENNLWIGTDKGLSKFNLETESLSTYYSDKNIPGSIESDRIRALAMGSDGKIWVGTRDAGLNIYNPLTDSFSQINFDSLNVKFPSHIKTIYVQDDTTLWLGALYDGLYKLTLSGQRIVGASNYRSEDSIHFLGSNDIYTLFKDSNGELIVGTQNGLFAYQESKESFREIRPLNMSNATQTAYYKTIFSDRRNNLWIGTYEGLLICKSFKALEKGDYSLLNHIQNLNHTISHDQILNIFQDESGVIWIGTENGLNRFDPYQNQFQPFSGKAIHSLKEQSATVFLPYRNGILILTHSDGVLYKKGDEIVPFSKGFDKDPELQNIKFYSMFVDSKSDIWLGSYNGMLIKLDSKGNFQSKYKILKDNVPIFSIEELNDKYLLIGTGTFQGGLLKFNRQVPGFSDLEDLLSTIQINKIHTDRNRNIWLATQQGIYLKRFTSESFYNFMPDNPDSVVTPNVFNDITESSAGHIYVAGRNGLYFYQANENRFVKLELSSITNLWVTNLQFDSKGVLWLNLNFNSIASWDIKTGKITLFHVNNGVRNTPLNHRGFYIDKADVLYFSGFDQMFYCNTGNLEINTFSPPPVFTKLLINNTEVKAGNELNSQVVLDKQIGYSNNVTLNYKNRNFALFFSSTSYTVPRNNKFRYKLHGYDKEWITGYNKSAQYPNLKPGRYVFEVYSANSYGIWSDKPAILQVHIKPSPFLSVWAFCIYLILLFFAAYQIHGVIITRIRLKRELLIEKVKREKEEAFHQERLRFYTNISHELRTPLTLIMGPVKQLIDLEKNNLKYIKLFQLIHDNSQRLLSLVNQILDFRKSLFEGAKLRVTYVNLAEIIESNLQAFEYMAIEKSIEVCFEKEEEIILGWFDLDKLDSILFNILSNAFKYTPANGGVSVKLSSGFLPSDKGIKSAEIKISNTGKGIPKHLQEKVFERFYKIDDKDDIYKSSGSGIGLALVKNLVELHHGTITLESEPGITTSITVILPAGKEAYSIEEIFDFKRDADRRTKELIDNAITTDSSKEITKPANGGVKLLLIEDNSELKEFLVDYLESDYTVITASDGLIGLDICMKEQPGLVVSDIMMDNMSGIEFCKKLRSTPEISHIPVILMTALASAENKIDGYKNGADDYITKPFEPELLKIRVKNLLDTRNSVIQGFRQNQNISAKELTISKIDEDFMEKFISLIDKNMQEECLEIESLSKELGISTSQMYRKIKGITSLSPIEFVNSYKLKKAAKMLKETNMNISEIAYEVGFSNPNYFSRIFKKQYTISPSQYKESL